MALVSRRSGECPSLYRRSGVPARLAGVSDPVEPTAAAPTAFTGEDAVRAELVPPELWVAAGSRLVGQSLPDVDVAGQRLVEAAADVGLDFNLCWGVLEPDPAAKPRVRQACLAVLSEGRTGMMFLSEPLRGGDPGGPARGALERAACIDAACAGLLSRYPGRIQLAQALPDPAEAWALSAYKRAGFIHVTTLHSLRRPAVVRMDAKLRALMVLAPAHIWPKGVRVSRLDELGPRGDGVLLEALEATYDQTLDCPELCGMRTTADVLASHKAAGTFDPALWWLLEMDGKPEGCCLMSPSPAQRALELVYLGLSPRVRGLGLGKRLLALGIAHAGAHHRAWPVHCAVDQRNEPARKLYERFGFEETGRREALVRMLGGAPQRDGSC